MMQGDAAHLTKKSPFLTEKSLEPSAVNSAVNISFVLCKGDIWVLW